MTEKKHKHPWPTTVDNPSKHPRPTPNVTSGRDEPHGIKNSTILSIFSLANVFIIFWLLLLGYISLSWMSAGGFVLFLVVGIASAAIASD